MASASAVQRALIMVKPDAMVPGLSVKAANKLVQRLHEAHNINASVNAPILFMPTPEFVDRFYSEAWRTLDEGLRRELALRFISASSNPGVLQAPILAFVVEAEVPAGKKTLYDFLRDPSVVGPTWPEKAVHEGLTHEDKVITADQVKASVRYQLKLEEEGSFSPPYEIDPRFNAIHCTATPKDADREIDLAYKMAMNWFPVLGVTDYAKEAQRIASYFGWEYNPRHFRSDDIELLLRDWNSSPDGTDFKLVTITGASGSGKSTILERLDESKKAGVIPVFTDRIGAGGIGEEYASPEEFDAFLEQGLFAAVEEAYGARYGVLKTSLRLARYRGGVQMLACGPAIAAALKEKEIDVHTLYLRVSEEKLKERLREREEESDRPAEEREKTTLAVREALEKLKGQFDVEFENSGELDELDLDAILDFIAASTGLKPMTYSYDSPRALRARKLLSMAVTAAQDPAIDARTLGTIRGALYGQKGERAILNLLTILMRDSSRLQEAGRNPLTQLEADAFLDFTPKHVLDTIAVAIQAGHTPETFAVRSPGLGVLSLLGNREREKKNLARIRALAAAIPEKERILLVAAHDLGKPGDVNDLAYHDKNGYELIVDCRLFQGFPFLPLDAKKVKEAEGKIKKILDGNKKKEELKKVEELKKAENELSRRCLELAIKHHHAFGGFYVGHSSLEVFAEMLEDEDVKKFLLVNGKIDIFRAKALLDRILFITIADIGSHGNLSNLRVETYFELREIINNIMEKHKNNPGAAIAEIRTISGRTTPYRLGAAVSVLDQIDHGKEGKEYFMDYRPEGLAGLKDYLDKHLAASKIRSEIMSHFHRIEFLYAFPLCDLAKDESSNTEENVRRGQITANPLLFTYLGFLVAELQKLDRGRRTPVKKLSVKLVDKNGVLIFGFANEKALEALKGKLKDGLPLDVTIEDRDTDNPAVVIMLKEIDVAALKASEIAEKKLKKN